MTPQIVAIGDSCLSVVFDRRIDPDINTRCISLAAALERAAIPGTRDVVPSFHTVTVYFDPATLARETLRSALAEAATALVYPVFQSMEPKEIPVNYGGDAGPDLAAVAEFGCCSEAEAVRRHSEPLYRVYMLGFLPGFAYLGSVDPRIAMPRLDVPRLRVPAGSVGIAGAQTGIYPCDTPGGWRIIGRTTVQLFDAASTEPSLLKAGDLVTFVSA